MASSVRFIQLKSVVFHFHTEEEIDYRPPLEIKFLNRFPSKHVVYCCILIIL